MRRDRAIRAAVTNPLCTVVGAGLLACLAASCVDTAAPQGSTSDGGGGSSGATRDTGAPVVDAGEDDNAQPPTPDTAAPAPSDTDPGNQPTDVAPTTDVAGDRPTGPLMGLVKIMVIGSSNETDTCWRAFLWQKLRAAGVTSFDLVGRMKVGPDCGVAGYDKDVEAQAGTIFTSFSANDFATKFKANPPQIVLVHVAGADARNGTPIPQILKAYSLAVDQARLVNPEVTFFVAQHTPQVPPTGIAELNAAIPGWAAGISTPQSYVAAVDLFSIIVPSADQSDGTHLNISGSQKVADAWMAKLLPLLKP